MIKNPWLIIGCLLTIEIGILWLSNHPRFKKYFSFLPSIFWIYFLPMVLSTIGLIDAQSPIYSLISTNFLPISLFLLLMTVDLKAILKLGRPALLMFLSGGLGVMVGGVVVFLFFKDVIGRQMWSGFGALSGSWTGGSANMIAVKEALSTPDHVFLPMVVVDTIVPYVWMGMLISLVTFQPIFDRWNKSEHAILEDLQKRAVPVSSRSAHVHFLTTFLIVGLAMIVTYVAKWLVQFLPVIKDVISSYTWMIIVVSLLGLAASMTPLRKVEKFGSTRIGYFFLYFVLTSIGAKASLRFESSTLILIALGFLWITIHGAVLVLAARWLKAPMFLVAVASQANVGGVASAPIVAEVYQPGLSSIGLLLAVFGNIIGTYLGIMTGQVCYWLSTF